MASTTPTDLTLQIFSHNVQGLNSPVKRCKILQQRHTLKADVLLSQETHFPATHNPSFLHKNFTQFYLANAENKTRGVAICFSKRIHFSLTKVIRDREGRCVLVSGTINRGTYTFISYYAPNKGQGKFFKAALQTLKPHLLGTVILGGDSNTPFDLSLDKSNSRIPRAKRPPIRRLKVAHTLQENNLVDIWREMKPPHQKLYTLLHSTPHPFQDRPHFFANHCHPISDNF